MLPPQHYYDRLDGVVFTVNGIEWKIEKPSTADFGRKDYTSLWIKPITAGKTYYHVLFMVMNWDMDKDGQVPFHIYMPALGKGSQGAKVLSGDVGYQFYVNPDHYVHTFLARQIDYLCSNDIFN